MSSKKKLSFFERFSNAVTNWAGSSFAFSTAFLVIVVWAISGPFFNFSETWQLVINTGTTIITFLMVFLIQKSQNKDSKAIQLKLNELIAADERASNRMVDLEDMTEEELDKLHKFYEKLSDLAEKEDNIHTSHSIDAAEKVHKIKKAKKVNPVKKIGLAGNSTDSKSDSPVKNKKPAPKTNAK
ncbi:MAG: low affinity iron permease family protein [Bacteroidota bacterium]